MSVNVVGEVNKVPNAELNILVVDDDALNQRMMQLILTREGYTVTIASNGVEAVELTDTRDFDVVLMDLQMPVLDGMGASRRIREREKNGRHTFIVALTASFLPEKGHELYEAGIDNYISKPFDLEHLRQILRYSHGNKIDAKTASADKLPSDSGISFEVGLQRIGGDKEVYKELLSDFINELPGKMQKIESCHANHEYELLSRLAHNLKGVAANLGGIRLSEQSGRLEKQIDSGATSEIKHIIDLVRVVADEFQQYALKYLAG